MGTGIFKDGKFNFIVSAEQALTDTQRAEWRARFTEASQSLFDATEGQMQFGEIHLTDGSFAQGHADVILHSNPGRAFATYGRFGTVGENIHLFDEQRTGDARTIVHEMGHHLFGLGDEYTGPVLTDQIDTDANLPPNVDPLFVIPILDPQHAPADVEFSTANLRFGNVIETRIVQSYVDNGDGTGLVTVFGGFPNDTRTASGSVFYQRTDGVGCAEQDGATFSLMDAYSGSPAITEFCTSANHDPDQDTHHTGLYGPNVSCWDVIVQTMADRWNAAIALPGAAANPGPTTAEAPVFGELQKEYRTMLVADRSGSMASDGKIQGVRTGVDLWLHTFQIAAESLGILTFNTGHELRLPLTPMDSIDATAESDSFAQEVQAEGGTNIRDALFAAANQIAQSDGRAAESVILLTDGIHNTPSGSSLLEVIGEFQSLGIPVFALPLGGPEVVEYEPLEELARMTGGAVFPIPQSLANDIDLNYLIGIYMGFLANGIHNGASVFTFLDIGAQPKTGTISEALEKIGSAKTLPSLPETLKILEIGNVDELANALKIPNSPLSVQRVLVEERADHAAFTIHWNGSERFALYLIDPGGQAVAIDGDDVVRAVTDKPYDLIVVKRPKPGAWRMVSLRLSPGDTTWLGVNAGCRNSSLRVDAGCTPRVHSGGAAGLWAYASFGDALTNLRVTATVRSPEGQTHHVLLSDDTPDEIGGGRYKGAFFPLTNGRYTGEIQVSGRENARIAGGLRRVAHGPKTDKDGQSVALRATASPFRRVFPIYFDVGPRPIAKDYESGTLERPKYGPSQIIRKPQPVRKRP